MLFSTGAVARYASRVDTRTDTYRTAAVDGDVEEPWLWIAYHSDPSLRGRARALADGERVLLGRDSDALPPGALADGRISNRHAEISRTGLAVGIRDLGGRNGTFVNGRRVLEEELHPGDVVSIAGVVLLVSLLPANWRRPSPSPLIGASHALAVLQEQTAAAACQSAPVLLVGEPGAGKDLVAREIHRLSGREGLYVPVNCAALSDELLASELFGHARGAYSGARHDRDGLVVHAAGGTLFLDEIGDASEALQGTLLRVLESGEFRAVGSDHNQVADVRFVAATNRDLDVHLRPDLRSRLEQWTLAVPPLREHREDVLPLATYFVRELAKDTDIGRGLAEALLVHDWPGNVRELRGVVRRAYHEAQGARLVDVVPASLQKTERAPGPVEIPKLGRKRPDAGQLREWIAEYGGNVSALASALGVARNTVYRWARAHEVDLSEWRDD